MHKVAETKKYGCHKYCSHILFIRIISELLHCSITDKGMGWPRIWAQVLYFTMIMISIFGCVSVKNLLPFRRFLLLFF